MKLLKLMAVAVAALAMVACNGPESGVDTPIEKSPFRMEVSSSWVQIDVDHAYFLVYLDDVLVNHEELTFYDENDEEVTMSPLEIEIDGSTVTVPEWIPTKPETKSFWVSYKSYYTKELKSITAVNFALPQPMEDPQPANKSFVKRTFFTQFTGADCGYCPFAKASLYEAANDPNYADKFVVAAIYTYQATDDLYPTNYANIDRKFGVSSYPTVFFDMKGIVNQEKKDSGFTFTKAAIDESHKEDAKAGIAVNVASDDGDTFVARISVKAAVDGVYYVGAWLVEDGLYEKQANYGCNADIDFNTHNNVLRIADSGENYVGHSLGAMKAGEIKDQVVTMTIKDPNPNSKKEPWVKENCRLVVFVTTEKNNGSVYVTNVVANDVYSESIEFEYK